MHPIDTTMEPGRKAVGVILGIAISCMLTAKIAANYRPSYVRSLRQYLGQFAAGREDMAIAEVSVDIIERWFAERQEAPTAQAANTGRLSALFSFARRRGWIKENPCDYLEKIRIDEKPAAILTVEQARKTMEFSMYQCPQGLAFFTLALFQGIRPQELERLDWSAIDLEKRIVRVDACASKVRTRRIVHLEANAVEWLDFASCMNARLPFCRSSRQRALKGARDKLGLTEWPQDILRHTAASFMMASKRDVCLVADELGNSPSVLLRKYRELVTTEDCLAFWSIAP